MYYKEVLKIIEKASLFDIYQLKSALNILLGKPARLKAIKAQLHTGQVISYFCESSNKLIDATIVKIKRTSVEVINAHDNRKWRIAFCAINLNNEKIEISSNTKRDGLTRNQLHIGEIVGFPKGDSHEEVYGTITHLNPKTVKLVTFGGTKWTVPYNSLFKVLD